MIIDLYNEQTEHIGTFYDINEVKMIDEFWQFVSDGSPVFKLTNGLYKIR